MEEKYKKDIHTKDKILNEALLMYRKDHYIQVTRITNNLKISRNSFYLYFDSIDDLNSAIENKYIKEIIDQLKLHPISTYLNTPSMFIDTFAYIINKQEIYFLLNSKIFPFFKYKLASFISEYLYKQYIEELKKEKKEYIYSIYFLISGFINTLIFFDNKKEIDLEFILRRIKKISLYGINETYLLENTTF